MAMIQKNSQQLSSEHRLLLNRVNHSTIVQFGSLMFSLALGAFLIRYVGSSFFGQLTSANSIVSICIVFTSFGWPVLLTKVFALGHALSSHNAIRRAVINGFFLTLLCGATIYLLIYFEIIATTAYSLIFLPILILMATMSIFAKSILDGLGKVLIEQYTIGILSPSLIMLIIYIASPLKDINKFFSFYSLSLIVNLFILSSLAVRFSRKGLRSKDASPVVKVSHNWLLMSASLSNVFLLNTDLIILSKYVPMSSVGIYGMIVTLVSIMTLAISAGSSIYAPIIVKQYQENDLEGARLTFKIIQKHVLKWSLPCFAILSLFSEEILFALTGKLVEKEFSRCLIILAVAQLVNAVTGPVATSLYMKGQIKFFASSMVFAAILNLIGNLFLVPGLGVVGAASSTALAISLTNLVQFARAKYLKIA